MKLRRLLTSFPILAFVMNVAARPMLLQGREIHLLHQPRGMKMGLPQAPSQPSQSPADSELQAQLQALRTLADVFLNTNLLILLAHLKAASASGSPGAPTRPIRALVDNVHSYYSRLDICATALRRKLENQAERFGTDIQPVNSNFQDMIKQLCYINGESTKRAIVILKDIGDKQVHTQLARIRNLNAPAHWTDFRFMSQEADNFLLDMVDLCNEFYSGYNGHDIPPPDALAGVFLL